MRLALGAARGRLVRQLLTESVTLSVLGGALGILLAFWGARALIDFAATIADGPSRFSADLDLRVLGFTLAAALLTGILFGLAPALRSMRIDLTPALKDGAAALNARQGHFRLGNILVVTQVALTVVVLVGAGLVVHTLQNLRNLDPGFATDNLLTFDVDATLTHYKGERLAGFYRDLRDRFTAIPGVFSVSYSDMVLLSGSLWSTDFHLPGTRSQSRRSGGIFPSRSAVLRDHENSGAAGPQIQAARNTNWPPRRTPIRKAEERIVMPAMVNEAFVRAYFPKGNPLGQPFGDYIPGVERRPGWHRRAPDGKSWAWCATSNTTACGARSNPRSMFPAHAGGSFELRTAAIRLRWCRTCARSCGRSASDIPVVNVKTQAQHIESMLFQERLIARLSSLFGLAALLLAAIGLYGLLAHEVTPRDPRNRDSRGAGRAAGTGPAARGASRRGVGRRGHSHRPRGIAGRHAFAGRDAVRCETRRPDHAHRGDACCLCWWRWPPATFRRAAPHAWTRWWPSATSKPGRV